MTYSGRTSSAPPVRSASFACTALCTTLNCDVVSRCPPMAPRGRGGLCERRAGTYAGLATRGRGGRKARRGRWVCGLLPKREFGLPISERASTALAGSMRGT